MIRRAAVAIALLALGAAAEAHPLDTFGFGARATALGGAVTASATGAPAVHHNPAGAAATGDATLLAGYSYAAPRLTLDGADAGVTSPRGTSLGLTLPVEIGGVRAAFGIAAFVPDQFLLRVRLVPAAEPHFILLDNGLHHIVITPVVAVAPRPWLQLGAGVTLLANAAGNGVDFDVGVSGGEKVGRARLDVELPIRAAPVAGVRVAPLPWLTVGASYRGALDLRLRFDVSTHVDIAGAVTGDVLIALGATNLYTPHKVALGVAVAPTPSLLVEADVEWHGWSGFQGGAADLRVSLDLSVSPSLVAATYAPPRFRDTWVPRLGVEYRRPIGARLAACGRLGYAFERSPVPAQVGLTSFADNDRHALTLGAGLTVDALPRRLRPFDVDVALAWHELVERVTHKDPRLLPGGGFTSGGRLVHVAATITARF